MAYVRATYISNLAEGDLLGVEVEGVSLVLVRQGDRVRAYQRRCLHQGADLADGIVSRGHLVCALHGWRFRLEDGALDMQPDSCLRMYPVRVDDDGAVLVDLG
jgi:methylamine---glutamate N-methyltransferase subunit C